MSALFCLTAHATAGTSGATDQRGGERIAAYAQTLVGTPYRARGSTPETGFDCSGFVQHVFLTVAHIDLPRRANDMARHGHRVAANQLRPGDLIFFNTLGTPFSHVGIYVGQGRFAHAPSTGGRVRIVEIKQRYWSTRFSGARRLLGRAPAA